MTMKGALWNSARNFMENCVQARTHKATANFDSHLRVRLRNQRALLPRRHRHCAAVRGRPDGRSRATQRFER
jgi:hypothetical protein